MHPCVTGRVCSMTSEQRPPLAKLQVTTHRNQYSTHLSLGLMTTPCTLCGAT